MKSALFALLAVCSACGSAERPLDEIGGAGGVGGTAAAGGAGGDGSTHVSPCGETADPPAFEVGTGETCFTALAPGAIVPRVGGPQGGFHVWGAFLCADCPHKVVVTIGLELLGEDELLNEPSERVVEVDSDQVAGLIALLPGTEDNPTAALPEGTEVRILITLHSLEGELLQEGETAVTLGELELWKP